MESGINTPAALYIDLSKAFDTLLFDILLYKLSHYGIKDNAFKLLKSYLTDRKQVVVFNNQNSETTDITTSVPQGSILGPLFHWRIEGGGPRGPWPPPPLKLVKV